MRSGSSTIRSTRISQCEARALKHVTAGKSNGRQHSVRDGINTVSAIGFDVRVWPAFAVEHSVTVMAIHDVFLARITVWKCLAAPKEGIRMLCLYFESSGINSAVYAQDSVAEVIALKRLKKLQMLWRHRIEKNLIGEFGLSENQANAAALDRSSQNLDGAIRVACNRVESFHAYNPRVGRVIRVALQHPIFVVTHQYYHGESCCFSQRNDSIHAFPNMRTSIDVVPKKH